MSVELICPYCQFSKKVPNEKIPVGAKWVTCPRCHQRFEFSVVEKDVGPVTGETERKKAFERLEEEPEEGYTRNGAPWENRSELGLWQGIYKTFKAVLFSPEIFFRSLTFKAGIVEPLAFGILVGSIGSMFGLFWQLLMWSGLVLTYGESIFGQFTIGVILLIIMVIIPILWVAWIFVSSGITHLLLLIVRGGENGYEATLRVVSYSQATQDLEFNPLCWRYNRLDLAACCSDHWAATHSQDVLFKGYCGVFDPRGHYLSPRDCGRDWPGPVFQFKGWLDLLWQIKSIIKQS